MIKTKGPDKYEVNPFLNTCILIYVSHFLILHEVVNNIYCLS